MTIQSDGMTEDDMIQRLLQEDPALAQVLMESMKAGLGQDLYSDMAKTQVRGGKSVGPYGQYVVNPWEQAADAVDRGVGLYQFGKGVDRQGAALDKMLGALGGGGRPQPPAPSPFAGPMGSPRAAGAEDIPGYVTQQGTPTGPGRAAPAPLPPQPAMPAPVPIPSDLPPQGGTYTKPKTLQQRLEEMFGGGPHGA